VSDGSLNQDLIGMALSKEKEGENESKSKLTIKGEAN
jgi:hypothetical protein